MAAESFKLKRRVVIVPGNGSGCHRANFYPWLRRELLARGFSVELRAMPDPDVARASIWLPFISGELGADAETVLVGHSSGACAGLRLAEGSRLHALIAISVTPTDLDDENERASGYYIAPWDWEAMRRNVRHLVLFASTDDPFIPLELQRRARDGLEAAGVRAGAGAGAFSYLELRGKSHFFEPEQREILEQVLRVAGAP